MEKDRLMEKCKALIIGGSAGSLDVLLKVLPVVRPDISFPIIIVVHRKHGTDSLLPVLLSTRTEMRVKEVDEKEAILAGTIYVAPSDYHLLIEQDQTFSLDYSEKINYSRPAIDATFQTAAEVYRSQLVCLLLSGSNADGVSGLKSVKAWGGTAIIQDPETAQVAYMPAQAKLNVQIDYELSIEAIGDFINLLP
ncbi:chemotaxis protein CheB [Pedobacter heparinus]|uniref:protein-glutamate methylesterase n=1 Tax=Pedobacter heparinus (strain ATCC 13125 / DSM 2366 / CIP 104194 / JCM 7457 / NBRC 12017 / NCIMB 9290 / NRRL B-14731 / HIM 762-3) TaxID=485917 RepID=C6XXD0_PEDHD|nr:chemotaxis protein CheB [Pedobacter heparinus]ACU06436.1 Protein-glutamate methylesterase [Pedobacter heparinus DSM 2366]